MHHNAYEAGLCHGPHWESFQCSPDYLAGFGEGNGEREMETTRDVKAAEVGGNKR